MNLLVTYLAFWYTKYIKFNKVSTPAAKTVLCFHNADVISPLFTLSLWVVVIIHFPAIDSFLTTASKPQIAVLFKIY